MAAMLAILMALALATSNPVPNAEQLAHYQASLACSMLRPQTCEGTEDLWGKPDFDIQIRAFLRDRPVNYLYKGMLLRQFREAIGGIPDDVVRKGDLFLFPGCRRHYCPEKGVVVVKPDIGIVALAILRSDCNGSEQHDACYDRNILSIFVDFPDDPDKAVVDELSAWAAATVDALYKGDPIAFHPRLVRVEVLPARPTH